MTQIKHTGLKFLSHDDRDFKLGALIKWPKLNELPREYQVKPLSIKNQLADGNDDFCAACAGSGMIEPKEEAELFYPFLFAAAKYEGKDDVNSFGLELRSVGKALVRWGVPELKDVPDEVKNLTPDQRRVFNNYITHQELVRSADKHRAKTFFFINGPYDAYDNARAAQHYFRKSKQHLMMGVEWGWQLNDYTLTGFPHGFGHALWVNGWDNDGITVVNSAGSEAGKSGVHKITRETFNKYANDYGLMMVVDISREEAEYRLNNNLKLNENWAISMVRSLIKMIQEIIVFAFNKWSYLAQPVDNLRVVNTGIS